jgi:hypothetical protein
MSDSEKLDEILATLHRIEERQKKTTAMVADVQQHEAVGSFATSDLPDSAISER